MTVIYQYGPVFQKMLERIIYNRLYSFFYENNTLRKKQFGFKKQDSTDHAIVHLVNEILNSFDNCYAFGVFIDLTKVFDAVDLNVLLKNISLGSKSLGFKSSCRIDNQIFCLPKY